MRTPGDVRHAVAAGADLVGFVVFPPSPRSVGPDRLPALGEAAVGAERVVLTVDADDALIDGIAATGAADTIQLHGTETPERAAEVRRRTGLRVMKAVGVAAAEDLAAASAFAGSADRLLIDAKPAPGATRPGGNGLVFDWRLLEGWEAPLPWLLAGGLTPETAAEAVGTTGAPGLDVSSGVESAPGVKDPARVAAFVAAAKA